MEEHKAFATAALLHLLAFLRLELPLQSGVLHNLHFHHLETAQVCATPLIQSPQNNRLGLKELDRVHVVRKLSSSKNRPEGEALDRKPPLLHSPGASISAPSIVTLATAIPTEIVSVKLPSGFIQPAPLLAAKKAWATRCPA